MIHFIRWHPCRHAMARVANVGTADMACRFAHGLGAIMTITAQAYNFIVIHGYRWRPSRRRAMASTAIVSGFNMRRGFTNRRHAVMTFDTGANDEAVVDAHHVFPYVTCRMATATIVRGIDVRGVFAGRNFIVVTCRATTDDLGVVRHWISKRFPRGKDMACLAHVAGANMRDRFTRADHVIVTTDATIDDAVMRELTAQLPFFRCGIMTSITFGGGRNVSRWFAYCNCIIVARRTCALYLGMVNAIIRHFPVNAGVMAFLATITAGDVSVRFAGRIDAVMTANAITGIDTRMVERRIAPDFWRRLMAQIAFVSSLNVFRPFTNGDCVVVAT